MSVEIGEASDEDETSNAIETKRGDVTVEQKPFNEHVHVKGGWLSAIKGWVKGQKK